MTWQSFAAKWQELGGMGLRLIDFEMVNPAAGALFDGVDAGESDLPAADEPFGGVLAATAAPTVDAAAGQGSAQLDDALLDGRNLAAAVGGAELPNIVAPRSAADGHGAGLVSTGGPDRTGSDGAGGAALG